MAIDLALPIDATRYAQLASNTLAPVRPGLLRAGAAVGGVTDPQEAWELLAATGAIPMDWIEAPHRAFEGARGALARHPPSVRACVAFASDTHGVVTAERLAHEAAARLAPWGFTASSTGCVWRCLPALEWRCARPAWLPTMRSLARHFRAPSALALEPIRSRLPGEGRPLDERGDAGAWTAEALLPQIAHAANLWAALAARDEAAPAGFELEIPEPLAGRRIAQQDNPFVPLLALWEIGYVLDATEPADDARLTLVAADGRLWRDDELDERAASAAPVAAPAQAPLDEARILAALEPLRSVVSAHACWPAVNGHELTVEIWPGTPAEYGVVFRCLAGFLAPAQMRRISIRDAELYPQPHNGRRIFGPRQRAR